MLELVVGVLYAYGLSVIVFTAIASMLYEFRGWKGIRVWTVVSALVLGDQILMLWLIGKFNVRVFIDHHLLNSWLGIGRNEDVVKVLGGSGLADLSMVDIVEALVLGGIATYLADLIQRWRHECAE